MSNYDTTTANQSGRQLTPDEYTFEPINGGGGFRLTIPNANIPTYKGSYYTYLYLYYTLAPKDKAALALMAQDAAAEMGVANYLNSARVVDGPGPKSAPYTYTYNPVSKIPETISEDKLRFTLKLNPGKAMMNGGQIIEATDTHSSNISVNYRSIRVVEAVDGSGVDRSADVSWDYRGNTGTFRIPDGVAVELTYEANVIDVVEAEHPVTNEVEMLGYTDGTSNNSITWTGGGTTGIYGLRLFKYSEGHMESGLKGAKFRLLDANKMPMHYLKGEKAGQEIVFTTDEIKEIVHITDENGETVDKEVIRTGYVEVVLHQEQDGLAIRKNVPYYLEEIEAPVVKDDNGKVTERFEPDFTLYSFMISDNPNYNAPGGVYVYSSGDVLKVRNWPDEGGFWLAKRFNGNAQPPASVLNAMRFTLKKLNSQGEYETVRTLSWGDLNNGKLHITGLQPGTYMVVETGAEPPAGSGLTHITEYMVDGEDKNEGAVFTLTEEDLTNAVSHNVVITNTYYEKSFSITKVDQDSQAALRGAVFEARRADDDSLVTTYTTGGVQGRFAIQREINANQNYAYNTLYYVVETRPPEGYGYTDKGQIKSYFYFSDPADPQTPEGAGSAVDLTREFGTVTLENVGVEKTSVVATKAWQGLGGGTAAPNGATVTFTLFRDGEKVDGSEIVLNGVPDEVTEETTRAETQAWRAEWTDLVKWHWGNEGEKVDYDYMIRTAMATSRRPSPIPTRSGPRT